MYRNQTLPVAYPIKDENEDKKTRELGKLVAISNDGTILEPTGAENLLFPLISDVQKDDTVASFTVSGIGKVFVEAAAGINVGTPVSIGPLKEGVVAHTEGNILGIAFGKPKGDGDFIPVLLTHQVSETSIY